MLSVSGDSAQLEILKHAHCERFQWFYFRVSGVKGRANTLNITNAGRPSFSEGWSGYKARFSYERTHWQQQSSTRFENGYLGLSILANSIYLGSRTLRLVVRNNITVAFRWHLRFLDLGPALNLHGKRASIFGQLLCIEFDSLLRCVHYYVFGL